MLKPEYKKSSKPKASKFLTVEGAKKVSDALKVFGGKVSSMEFLKPKSEETILELSEELARVSLGQSGGNQKAAYDFACHTLRHLGLPESDHEQAISELNKIFQRG